MSYDLFISYSRRDNEQSRVTELVEHIKQDFAPFAKRELMPFFDQQAIEGMQDWRQRILQGLRESRLLLACLSPAYLKSEYCEWEFVEYLKYEIGHLHGSNGVAPIYFVQIPGWNDKGFDQHCAAWVGELRRRQNFDLRPWHEQGEAALRESAVLERMGKLNRQIAETITRGERAEKSLGNVDAHNPHFIGRTANLRVLRENFVTPGHIGVVTAVNGIGGLGKTALAIEYAHAFADEYGGGRWQVRCAGKDDLSLALAELATPIGFEFTDDEKKNTDLQFERIRRELKKLADAREPHRCLLLLDNVDRPSLVEPAQVARLNGGDWLHVVATTRLGENELYGSHRDRSFLAVDELPPDDALALIESYQPDGHYRCSAEREAAREIVRLLGCFTLAVESAAVYLGQFANEVACTAFLARLKKEGLEGLDTAVSDERLTVRHGEKRLGATVQPTLERLGVPEKLALEFASLLPPDQVPLPWLRALVAKTFPEMERDAEPGYPDLWKDVVRRLLSLRLLQATDVVDEGGQPRVVRVHRLVQELVLSKNVTAEARECLLTTIGEVAMVRSEFLVENWQDRDSWWELPPLLALAEEFVLAKRPQSVEIAKKVVSCLIDLAQITEGIHLGRAALAESERVLGPEHPTTINLINQLAILVEDQGDYSESEQLYRRALELAELELGSDDPTFLTIENNLGTLLVAMGNYSRAEPLRQRTLLARERILGHDHEDTLDSVMNLAYLSYRKGDLDASETLYRRALDGYKRVLGEDHHETLRCLHNFSMVMASKGDNEQAVLMAVRVITAWSKTLPADHPDLLIAKQDLACYLERVGRRTEADKLFREAIERYEQKLGFDHPDTLRAVGNYAGLLDSMGREQEGAILHSRVVEAQERRLGAEHPDTLRGWNNRSATLRKQGRPEQAEPIVRRVAETTARILGESHPLTIHRRNNLALTLIMLDKPAEARRILTANWGLNAPPYVNTTPCIAFLRYLIALLESQPNSPFLGQLRTLLTGAELPVAQDVAAPWDIGYFIEYVRLKLQPGSAEFLTALIAALNDHTKLPDLDHFPEWRNQAPIPLDTPWPSA